MVWSYDNTRFRADPFVRRIQRIQRQSKSFSPAPGGMQSFFASLQPSVSLTAHNNCRRFFQRGQSLTGCLQPDFFSPPTSESQGPRQPHCTILAQLQTGPALNRALQDQHQVALPAAGLEWRPTQYVRRAARTFACHKNCLRDHDSPLALRYPSESLKLPHYRARSALIIPSAKRVSWTFWHRCR